MKDAELKRSYESKNNCLEEKFLHKILGLDGIAQNIISAYEKNRIHHSILVTCSQGSGKAMLFARLAFVLLINKPELQHKLLNLITIADFASYCKVVDSYNHFIHLLHPDFIIISDSFELNSFESKKKLSISIDEIRKVSQFLSLTPVLSKYRVVLIDGIDSMNCNAANAILKILEEPKRQTFILLVAHNINHVLPTIRSRCCIMRASCLSYNNFCIALNNYIKARSDNTEDKQNIVIQNSKNLEFLYKVTRGNMSFAVSSIQSDINEIQLLIDILLSGRMNNENLARLREIIAIDINTKIFTINALKESIMERLYNKMNNKCFNYYEIAKYLENFEKVRKLLDDAIIFSLDLPNAIFSVLGV